MAGMEVRVSTSGHVHALATMHPEAAAGVLVRVVRVDNLEEALQIRKCLRGFASAGVAWVFPCLRRLNNLARLCVQLRDIRDRLLPHLVASLPLLAVDANRMDEVVALMNAGGVVRSLGREEYGGDDQALRVACAGLANRILLLTGRVLSAERTPGWMMERLPDLEGRVEHLLIEIPVNLPVVE